MYGSNSGCLYHSTFELPFHKPTSRPEALFDRKVKNCPSVEASGLIALMPGRRSSEFESSGSTLSRYIPSS